MLFKVLYYDAFIGGVPHVAGVSNVYSVRDTDENGNKVTQFLIYIPELEDINCNWNWIDACQCLPAKEEIKPFYQIKKDGFDKFSQIDKNNFVEEYQKI